MGIWTLLVVGTLLFPVEMHTEEGCRSAATAISKRLQATTLCVSPMTGQLFEYYNGELAFEQAGYHDEDKE